MLRITVHKNSQTIRLQLEGRLAGPWLTELDECWRRTFASERQPNIEVDLTGLISIDPSGQGVSGRNAPTEAPVCCRRL